MCCSENEKLPYRMTPAVTVKANLANFDRLLDLFNKERWQHDEYERLATKNQEAFVHDR